MTSSKIDHTYIAVLAGVAIAKYHRVDGCNSRNLFPQFWRLGIGDLGANMVRFWGGLFSWLSDGCLLALCSCGISLVWVLWTESAGSLAALPIRKKSHHKASTFVTFSKPKYIPKGSIFKYHNTGG